MRTHIDLFSGIGGFALACRWAGVQTVAFAEIDDYASKVLAKNFPGVTNYGDIRNVPPTDDVWLVTGGFPCQPFSVAGKQRGTDDDRWLWPEMAACIERIRPRWVLAENVPGIVGMELDTVLSDLEAIDYTAWAVVVPAVAVDAPHRRDRVWIVAHADNAEWRADDSAGKRNQGRHDADGIPGRQEISSRSRLCGAEAVAHTDAIGWDGRAGQQREGWRAESENSRSDVPHGNGAGLAQRQSVTGDDAAQQSAIVGTDRWQPEPGLGERVDGVSAKLDRIGGLDGQATESRTGEALSALRSEAGTETIPGQVGGHGRFPAPQVLRSDLYGGSLCQRHAILFGLVETGEAPPWELLRSMWGYSFGEQPSYRRQSIEQLAREYPDLMRELSHYASPPCSACWKDGSWEDGIPRIATGIANRVQRLKGLGNAIVPQVAYQLIRMMIEVEQTGEQS